jgi:hypothetical protein
MPPDDDGGGDIEDTPADEDDQPQDDDARDNGVVEGHTVASYVDVPQTVGM